MRHIIQRIRQRYRNRSIGVKLSLSYLSIVFILMAVTTSIIIYITTSQIKNNINHVIAKSFAQAHTFIEHKLSLFIYATDNLVYNDDLHTILSRDIRTYKNDAVQQSEDKWVALRILQNEAIGNGILYNSLYVPGWYQYAGDSTRFNNIDQFTKSGLYSRLIYELNTRGKGILWCAGMPYEIQHANNTGREVPSIELYRTIGSNNSIGSSLDGIQKSIIDGNSILDILDKSNLTQDGVVYLQNSFGELILCSNFDAFEQIAISHKDRIALNSQTYDFDFYSLNNVKYLVKNAAVENSDWTMIALIPFREAYEPAVHSAFLNFLTVFLIGIFACGIAMLFSKNITDRIKTLIHSMQDVQDKHFKAPLAIDSTDEIGVLFQNFNEMMERINHLVEQEYLNGIALKKQELNAMQSQINPHFLYNTLDLINWEALDAGAPHISQITQELARFYKLSLNKGDFIVSVKDELEHVRSYVNIQNFRFRNQIALEIRVDPAVLDYHIIKITLQPIVENAILHGIRNKSSKKGLIIISSEIRKDSFALKISDDGVGMDEEKRQALLYYQRKNEHGYGLHNIDQRIKLYYGDEYGLSFQSKLNTGTCVTIVLPFN